MKLAFWGSVGIIAYAYAGYPVWLWLRTRWRPVPLKRSALTPPISVLVVVRNEAAVLRRKLTNLLELDYPSDRLEILVVSDGSTDETNQILQECSARTQIHVMPNPNSKGKAAGLNDALQIARGEIVVFTDVRQILEREALSLLMENFADPLVGCASGELMLGEPHSGESGKGVGLYWRIEKQVREMESVSGSVVGATGALYAARRELVPALPSETILDDVYIPMSIVRQGLRVIFDSRARAWDVADQGRKHEFARKVRTLSGNYQLLHLMPWILSGANPIRFEFISNKLARLVVPFAMAAALVSSIFLSDPAYRVALLLQVGFYTIGILGLIQFRLGPLARIGDIVVTVLVLNTAAVVAFANFITRRRAVWAR